MSAYCETQLICLGDGIVLRSFALVRSYGALGGLMLRSICGLWMDSVGLDLAVCSVVLLCFIFGAFAPGTVPLPPQTPPAPQGVRRGFPTPKPPPQGGGKRLLP